MPRKSRYIVPPGMKRCPRCETIKPLRDFNGGYCADCYREYHRNWMAENHYDIVNDLLCEALHHYGGHCRDCAERDPRVLMIYPKKPGGRRQMLYDLRNAGWPAGYYALCANCAIKADMV